MILVLIYNVPGQQRDLNQGCLYSGQLCYHLAIVLGNNQVNLLAPQFFWAKFELQLEAMRIHEFEGKDLASTLLTIHHYYESKQKHC